MPCAPNSLTFTNVLVSKFCSTAPLPAEHRPKPEDLRIHITNRARQERSSYECASAVRTTYPYDWYCGTYPPPTGVSQRYTYRLSAGWYGTNPNVDWVTPTRLAIKDKFVNMASNLAEYRETCSMFAEVASQVYDFYKCLRGKKSACRRFKRHWEASRETRYPAAAAASKTAAQAWLTKVYGLDPLRADLEKSMQALELRASEPQYTPIYIGVQGESRGAHDNIHWHRKVSIKVKGWAGYDLSSPSSVFTAGNPLEVLWEGVPFSFVVDRLIPIGDYLSSLDAMKGVTGLYLSATTRETYRHVDRYASGAYKSESPGHGHGTAVSRQAYVNGLPQPPLPPLWKPSGSWKTVVNFTALLRALRP